MAKMVEKICSLPLKSILFCYVPLKIIVFLHCHWFIILFSYVPLPLLVYFSRAHAVKICGRLVSHASVSIRAALRPPAALGHNSELDFSMTATISSEPQTKFSLYTVRLSSTHRRT